MNRGPILLVEDSSDDEALIVRALTKHNVRNEIFVARDGAEALDWLHGERAMAPSIVLLDLKLPKIGGLTVLERIRGNPRTQHLPVVVLTSSDEPGDVARSYALGANSYVRKPIEFAQFTETVGQLGAYWLTVNESGQ